jgi:hypothetical protein
VNESILNNTVDIETVRLEYSSVREEILLRLTQRFQILAGVTTLASVFLSTALKEPGLGFIYPPLAAFITMIWHQNEVRMTGLKNYIRTELEPKTASNLQWETRVHERRSKRGRTTPYYHVGFIIVTQLLGLYLARSMFSVESLLLVIGIGSVLLSVYFMILAIRIR